MNQASTRPSDREAIGEIANPIGLAGIEFVEFATSKPQALGQVLETMGFRPVARHRGREVLLYRQGAMNIVVNSHASEVPTEVKPRETPALAAVALRVRDAGAAYRRAIDLGAWPAPSRAGPMELNIPAIHGVGDSRIFFVDRHEEFSIYDVDFSFIPTVDPNPPAIAGLHFFGIVQYVGPGRIDDWTAFYAEILGFRELPDEERFGILHKGRLLASPCGTFFWQLIEPPVDSLDADPEELLQRIGFGTPDVEAAASQLRARGVEFVETDAVHTGPRGALSRSVLGGVMFELVHDERKPAGGA